MALGHACARTRPATGRPVHAKKGRYLTGPARLARALAGLPPPPLPPHTQTDTHTGTGTLYRAPRSPPRRLSFCEVCPHPQGCAGTTNLHEVQLSDFAADVFGERARRTDHLKQGPGVVEDTRQLWPARVGGRWRWWGVARGVRGQGGGGGRKRERGGGRGEGGGREKGGGGGAARAPGAASRGQGGSVGWGGTLGGMRTGPGAMTLPCSDRGLDSGSWRPTVVGTVQPFGGRTTSRHHLGRQAGRLAASGPAGRPTRGAVEDG